MHIWFCFTYKHYVYDLLTCITMLVQQSASLQVHVLYDILDASG